MKNKHLANVVLVCVTTFFGVACTENFEEPKLDMQDNVLDGTLIDRFFS